MLAHFTLILPDDPALLARLTAAVHEQGDPPILVRRGHTVLTFDADTAEMMLRSRVIQALEHAVGPDWQTLARPVD